ncbi:hypothetical protein NC652_016315 [Populus alba x Populus x berolinensis]|nr:hypothetical protein NC651_015783 [Populus alba x Populus x berolinensis]KAJ6922629.1 hypothetical protein NC652_016315 [Populus alba x Populus x berolinensis]
MNHCGQSPGGESQNPTVPFSFLFINREPRQTGKKGSSCRPF